MSDISADQNKKNTDTAFLSDLTDARQKGDWKTRYTADALSEINWERNYLIAILIYCLMAALIIGIVSNRSFSGVSFPFINLRRYIFGYLGGTLGGTLFSIKWLVHSVAKDTWNIDRRLWRVFTPHLSGGLALIIIVLVNSQIMSFAKPESLSIHKCYGIGFLIGYFSDNAIGKLTELAQVLFGSNSTRQR